MVGVVTYFIGLIDIGCGCAGSNILNASDNATVSQDVNSCQVGSQRRTVNGESGSRHIDLGTQRSLLVGDNADGGCSGSRGFGTKVDAEVAHHEAILVGVADGMDGQIILASLTHREHTLKFFAHIIIGGHIGGLNDRGSQSLSSGLGTQQHLKTLFDARIIGIDNHAVVLASLELDGERDQVVIGRIVGAVIVIGMVSIIPIPCAAVLVGVNHREEVKGLGQGQISGIRHSERGNEFHGHDLALVTGAHLVIGHSIVLV